MNPSVTLLRTPGRAPRVLTVDVEEWFHVCGDDYYSDPRRWSRFVPRVERTLGWLLDALERGGHRATFFALGWIAERYPHLLREVVRRGHEVGLHGNLHRRADELTPEEFRSDVREARRRVERACGVETATYRAAEWSIRSADAPALAVLAEEGFRADASMTAMPPLGRAENPLGPHRIEFPQGTVVEAPPLTGPGFGRRIPAGGSWAFRFLSPARLRRCEEEYRRRGHPAVFTFHPWEFDADHPPMEGLAPLVRLTHFAGRRRLPERFLAWLSEERAVALGDALASLEAA